MARLYDSDWVLVFIIFKAGNKYVFIDKLLSLVHVARV